MNAPLTWTHAARTLAAEFAARAAAHERDASFPFENFTQLHEAGLLALAAPRELGGQGASIGQLGEVIGAIGQGDPATALVLTMQYLLANLDTGGLLGPHIRPLLARLGHILGTADDSAAEVARRRRGRAQTVPGTGIA